MTLMKKILVTGAGGSPSTNFIRSLRDMKEKIFIVGTDFDKYNINRSEADISYLSPSCKDKNYIDYLNWIIKKHDLQFMHVQNDTELEVVSQYRNALRITLFLPSEETVSNCMNKFQSYSKWQKNGLTVPKTLLISNINDLTKAYKDLGDKIWIRAISGAGGKGSLAPKDINQARAWIDFHSGWGNFTASQLLTPNSVTWMSIWNHGKLIVAQSRKRLYWELGRISPSGITGITGAGITVSDKAVDTIALQTIKSIDTKPHGIFSVDLTYDFTGIPNPTEINIGRFFTTHYFFTKAGINMPEIFVKLAYNENLPVIKRKINPLPPDLVWIRGVDFLPILTTRSKIEKHKQVMKKILQEL